MLPKLLSANALYQRLQQRGDLLLLDVRNNEEFRRSRIETRHTPETLNIPYVEFVEDDTLELALDRILRERPIVAVCAYGGSSEYVAGILRRYGYEVANLAGGMEGWAGLHVVRPVVADEWVEIFQIDRVARGCLSYVIVSDGWAVVVDPSRYTDEYLALLKSCGASLRLIVDTHAHADHISGGPALAQATGAPYYLHPYDAINPFDVTPASVDYKALYDGHRFRLGSVILRALHAPGHTLGHVVLLATTVAGQSYLFSGDTIFLSGIGRPDLGGQAELWACLAHETIFGTLKSATPANAPVLPGHYAGPGEVDKHGLYTSTFETMWATNKDLAFAGQEEFVSHVLTSLPWTPPEYVEIKRINGGLAEVNPRRALELEMGRNVCALSTAYTSFAPVPG